MAKTASLFNITSTLRSQEIPKIRPITPPPYAWNIVSIYNTMDVLDNKIETATTKRTIRDGYERQEPKLTTRQLVCLLDPGTRTGTQSGGSGKRLDHRPNRSRGHYWDLDTNGPPALSWSSAGLKLYSLKPSPLVARLSGVSAISPAVRRH